MNTLLKKLVSAILAIVIVIGMGPVIGANAQTVSVGYVTLGDSLTDYDTYKYTRFTSYPAYIDELVESTYDINFVVKNYGVGGYTADDLINQLYYDKTVIEDVKNADLVSVLIGGNDFIAAISEALAEEGINFNDAIQGKKLTSKQQSRMYIVVRNVLTDKKNKYHIKYISAIEEKIKNIVSRIEKLNPYCEIGIATLYYSDEYGAQFIKTISSLDLGVSYMYYCAARTSIVEIQGYFKAVADKDNRVRFVDTNALCNPSYLQTDSAGKLIDWHPNEAGQRKLAECFAGDFLAKVTLTNPRGLLKDDPAYSFYALDFAPYSAGNVLMGDKISMSIDSSGTGSKLYCTRATAARTFEFTMKPAKASGIMSGVSFWDDTNQTEVLLRFEGTNSKYINLCVGGNGKYISKQMKLGYDASTAEHAYSVEFNSNTVIVKADGKTIGSLDVSGINSPVSDVTPILFTQTANWLGTFEGNKVTTVFADFR